MSAIRVLRTRRENTVQQRDATLPGRRTWIGKTFPEAKVVDNEHIVTDGNMMSSIGELMTYDASLALVAQIAGQETADKTAEALYYFPVGENCVVIEEN